MKKKLLCLLALTVGLSSCQKEKNSRAIESSKTKTGLSQKPRVDVAPVTYSYVDLTLLPRAPGVTYDTYHCIWLSADIYVTSVSWDNATYPTLYNGVPLYGTVSTNPANGFHNAAADGKEGTAFVITLPTICGLPSPKLSDDIAKYEGAVEAFTGTGAVPNLETYVAKDYGNANCPQVTYQLRLIRCTTGSHYGVATADYPFTYVSPTGNIQPLYGDITDPLNGTIYYILGTNGRINSISKDGLYNVQPTPGFSVRGTYSFNPQTTMYSFSGTVTRPNGTTYTFNVLNQNIII